MPVPDRPRRVGLLVVLRVDGATIAASCGTAPKTGRVRRLRRLTDWLRAVVATDGMSDRFAMERQRDQELIRRVECTRLRQ